MKTEFYQRLIVVRRLSYCSAAHAQKVTFDEAYHIIVVEGVR